MISIILLLENFVMIVLVEVKGLEYVILGKINLWFDEKYNILDG